MSADVDALFGRDIALDERYRPVVTASGDVVLTSGIDTAQLAVGGPWTLHARACHSVWGCSEDSEPYVLMRPPRLGKIVGTIQLVK